METGSVFDSPDIDFDYAFTGSLADFFEFENATVCVDSSDALLGPNDFQPACSSGPENVSTYDHTASRAFEAEAIELPMPNLLSSTGEEGLTMDMPNNLQLPNNSYCLDAPAHLQTGFSEAMFQEDLSNRHAEPTSTVSSLPLSQRDFYELLQPVNADFVGPFPASSQSDDLNEYYEPGYNFVGPVAHYVQPLHLALRPGASHVVSTAQDTTHFNETFDMPAFDGIQTDQLQSVYEALCIQQRGTQAALDAIRQMQTMSSGTAGSSSSERTPVTYPSTSLQPQYNQSASLLLARTSYSKPATTASQFADETWNFESELSQSIGSIIPSASKVVTPSSSGHFVDSASGSQRKREASPATYGPQPPKRRRNIGKIRPYETCHASWNVKSTSQEGNTAATSIPKTRSEFNRKPCALCQVSQKRCRGGFPCFRCLDLSASQSQILKDLEPCVILDENPFTHWTIDGCLDAFQNSDKFFPIDPLMVLGALSARSEMLSCTPTDIKACGSMIVNRLIRWRTFARGDLRKQLLFLAFAKCILVLTLGLLGCCTKVLKHSRKLPASEVS